MSSHWHCEQKEKIECERAREKEQRSSGIMGNQKQKWTVEEEALLNGVAKHGPGKWKNILKDPDFAPFLTQRSNIDLKRIVKRIISDSRYDRILFAFYFTSRSEIETVAFYVGLADILYLY
ncbi:uncharacterized protein LOC110649803 isoform X2 [Hevea brasiliensis]|uniref:uncharacterized protein LOC110649803 isoform X2 n=1 Tax=Hevea brasiliensis TaxID=3981 RepID=UPI0025D9B103|nr:uncharacterized protein LOC110649803 isoform X2 [Hevea brasiliensis]